MGTYLILGAICVLLMILLTIGKRIGYGIIIEKLAIFWFRLACSFAFLYIAHITVDGFDIIVPVNFFSALTITILGFPGVLCIAVLTLLQ
ncbi:MULTISPECIES: pro-sigmaK processing inhibitor BofA family protein [Ureibacillus]|uniref:Inhibitor of the pro-sigma K processing machinery n=1 Tax=Ureibacillus thermosphaericus TaxID=51173 RepID=A0A840Q5Q2_URETH|nr:pro-sigmaK processing inhibitor BofA family protein [Ureibacillus thermosphaericus]MBB5150286.1 inhibitor of the pro-sigma K processing machinery [Ureibacillus thermosphaericus]NKZ32912.1 pro-sigmaK processing inhibitor BofA [Ureibacillus thermosphaericus]